MASETTPPSETTPLLADDVSSAVTNEEEEGKVVSKANGNGHGQHGAESSGSSSVEAGTADDVAPPTGAAMVTIIAPLALGIFLAAMDQTIVASAYASIGSELKHLESTSWVATGYMLTLTSFQPLYGKMSDIFGRKACLLFAYSVFALGSLFCGLARTMPELIAARMLAGIGGGGMTTVVSIIISDLVPLRSRGTWQGILNIFFATGSATGAPLGGLFADSIGWRWAFLVQVPATLVAILSVSIALRLPAPTTIPSDFRAKLRRIDFAGALSLVIWVFTLLFGLDQGGNHSFRAPLTLTALGLAFLFFLVFAAIELRWAREPFAPRRIVVHPSLLAAYLANFFDMASVIPVLFHVALYAQAVHARSAAAAGITLLPAILSGVVGSLGGGLIMQKSGKYYWLTVASAALLTAGLALVTLTTGVLTHSSIGLAVGLVLGMLGNGSVITTTLISLIANAGPEDQAIATAVSYLFRSLGAVVGLSLASTILQDTLRRRLREHLTGHDVDEIVRRVRESLAYVKELDPATQVVVREAYSSAVSAALYFSTAMAAAVLICSFFVREKALPGRAAR